MNDDLIRRSAVRRLMNHMACATIYADELEAIPSVTPDGYTRGFAAGIEAAAPEPVVRVKPLVWQNFDAWNYWAETQFGNYRVRERNGGWWVEHDLFDEIAEIHEDDLDAAKAAAQEHFSASILAAITSRPEAEVRADEMALAEAQYALTWAKANFADIGVPCGCVERALSAIEDFRAITEKGDPK